MADASDLVQEAESAQAESKGEALFNDVFGKDSEEEEAKKRLAEKLKEKATKAKPEAEKQSGGEKAKEDAGLSDAFKELKNELGQQKIAKELPAARPKKQYSRKPKTKETNEAGEALVDSKKHREAIKKFVLSKAAKAAEEEKEQAEENSAEDEESEVHDFLEKNVVQEVSDDDLLKEQGTKEEGIRASEREKEKPRESIVEKEEREKQETSTKIKPDLSFLQDNDGNVFIGRKQSVFQKYGTEAALFIGKVLEDDCKDKCVSLDGLNPHVVFVCGSRGSGKSYLLGIIAEELALKNPNVGVVVVDPVGVFWSMRFPNKDEKELDSLAKWNLKPRGLDNVRVFIPEGMKDKVPGNTFDATFSLPPALLTAEDWCLTFGIDRFSPSGLLLEKALFKVKKGYSNKDGKPFKAKPDNFSLEELIKCLEADSEINSPEKGYKSDSIRALSSRFDAAKSWGIFEEKGTPLAEISKEKQLTIIDTSFLDDNVSALVIGLLARRLLAARKLSTRKESSQKFNEGNVEQLLEFDVPPTWLFIDEAHTLIPSGNVKTPASNALIEYVKQGRQPGCSLVFATQQPSAIDTKVLSQLDIIVAHKLVFDDDVKAVFKRTPTIIPKQYKAANFIKTLPVGIAMAGDRREETSRAFILKVRPRMSQHEGREAVTTERQKAPVTKEQAKKFAVEMAFGELSLSGSINSSRLAQIIQAVNSKFKQSVASGDVLKELQRNGVVADEKKSILFIPEKMKEIEKDVADDARAEAQKEQTSQPEAQKAKRTGLEPEELELAAFPVRVNEAKARAIAESKAEKKMFGLLGKKEMIKGIELRFEPVYRIKYEVRVHGNEFVSRECFINSVSGEFIHFENSQFIESNGVKLLWNSPQEELGTFREIDSMQKRGKPIVSDIREDKNRAMKELLKKGLLKQDFSGGRAFFEVPKEVSIPTDPQHALLQSIVNIPFAKTEVVSIEKPLFGKNEAEKLMQSLFPETNVKRIDEIYRPVYEAILQSVEKSRIIKIDAMTAQIL